VQRKGLVSSTLVLLPIAAIAFVFSIFELFSMKTVTVDPKLKEISGIEFDKYKRMWAINDGGDGPKLYMLNKDGSIAREVTVSNAKNVDWEDMTQNRFGHFFLGDFGNNDNDRRWLTIYKIENPIDIKTDTTTAEIIKFTYPQMQEGEIKPQDKNYDLEAFVEYKRHLYLFTKNRTKPFDGITKLYKVGDHAANFDAELIGEFKTCTTLEKLCWITSAAMSPDRTKLVLLDSTSVWLFENFEGDNFFNGDISRIDLGVVTQKEAVTFYDDNTLVFTDEEFQGLVGGNIYEVKLDQVKRNVIKYAQESRSQRTPKQ
jgi:hypothetical protein